uniref:Uncharacterized protein n=1 Tax=Rhipicephalus microplus TaxID=6941 RepID=A0A6G5AFA6_RHIMP
MFQHRIITHRKITFNYTTYTIMFLLFIYHHHLWCISHCFINYFFLLYIYFYATSQPKTLLCVLFSAIHCSMTYTVSIFPPSEISLLFIYRFQISMKDLFQLSLNIKVE